MYLTRLDIICRKDRQYAEADARDINDIIQVVFGLNRTKVPRGKKKIDVHRPSLLNVPPTSEGPDFLAGLGMHIG